MKNLLGVLFTFLIIGMIVYDDSDSGSSNSSNNSGSSSNPRIERQVTAHVNHKLSSIDNTIGIPRSEKSKVLKISNIEQTSYDKYLYTYDIEYRLFGEVKKAMGGCRIDEDGELVSFNIAGMNLN